MELPRRKWTGTTHRLIEDLELAYDNTPNMFSIRIHHGGKSRRSEKMLTWHDFSQPTKEPVFDSVTPRSLPQHDSGTPCKDSVCESVTPSQVIEDVMIQPSFEETELDGEAGFRDVFGDINLSFVSQQASSSQVIEDVMMQLSFEETELDGKASFGDVAGILKVQGYVMMSLFELKT
ncbi:hypothetical protein Tco_0865228 [Tanacetum coccineum]